MIFGEKCRPRDQAHFLGARAGIRTIYTKKPGSSFKCPEIAGKRKKNLVRRIWCGRRDLNPQDQWSADFKSAASTDFATSALPRLATKALQKPSSRGRLVKRPIPNATEPHLHRLRGFGQRGVSHTRTDFLPMPDARALPARVDRRRIRPNAKAVCVPWLARLQHRRTPHRRPRHSTCHEA